MNLERAAVWTSWGLLTFAVLPSLLVVAYWLSLLPGAFSPPSQRDPNQVLWTLIITLATFVLGVVSAVGWNIMQRLRRAVQFREPPPARVWAGSLGFNLILLALSLILPRALDWYGAEGGLILVLVIYGLPAAFALQVWLSAMGWLKAHSRL